MVVPTLAAPGPGLEPWPDSAPVNAVLAPRQTDARDLIDPVTMPYCEWSACWQYQGDPPELCPLVDGPCPDDDDNSNNGGRTCGTKQYTRDCYCRLKTGIHCAWSCSWTDWWDTEDWLARVCAGSPAALALDFSPLPDCARDCLDDESFSYGCITGSSNCFCANGDLFGCQDACTSEGEWAAIQRWLQDSCGMKPDAARVALAEGTFTVDGAGVGFWAGFLGTAEPEGTQGPKDRKIGPPPPPPADPPTWDEITMFAVLAMTVLVGFGFWIFRRFARG